MMKCCSMTFRTAIGCSIAVHVALFGSALAFAHYGGSLLPSEFRSITVSLVGPRGGEQAVRRAVPERVKSIPLQELAVVEEGVSTHEEVSSVETGADNEWSDSSESGPAGEDRIPASGSAAVGYSSDEWSLLRAALERAKTYPRFARERGIEGTVLVRFKVRPTGGIERVDVVKSSGAKILDDASVKTIYRAAPVPYVEGWVEVPMIYQLRTLEPR